MCRFISEGFCLTQGIFWHLQRVLRVVQVRDFFGDTTKLVLQVNRMRRVVAGRLASMRSFLVAGLNTGIKIEQDCSVA